MADKKGRLQMYLVFKETGEESFFCVFQKKKWSFEKIKCFKNPSQWIGLDERPMFSCTDGHYLYFSERRTGAWPLDSVAIDGPHDDFHLVTDTTGNASIVYFSRDLKAKGNGRAPKIISFNGMKWHVKEVDIKGLRSAGRVFSHSYGSFQFLANDLVTDEFCFCMIGNGQEHRQTIRKGYFNAVTNVDSSKNLYCICYNIKTGGNRIEYGHKKGTGWQFEHIGNERSFEHPALCIDDKGIPHVFVIEHDQAKAEPIESRENAWKWQAAIIHYFRDKGVWKKEKLCTINGENDSEYNSPFMLKACCMKNTLHVVFYDTAQGGLIHAIKEPNMKL